MKAAMTRRLPLALAASVLLVLPSAAGAAPAPLHPSFEDTPPSFKGVPGPAAKKKTSKKKKVDRKAPVVKKITPRNAKVGDLLVVTGKNFVRGKGKNRVTFYTSKGGAVFAKDAGASTKRLKVRIPAKLAGLLPANGDQARIRLRVRGKRLGKTSAARISPLVAITPDQVGGDTSGPEAGDPVAPPACSPNFGDPLSDVDKDLLTDAQERDLGLNACDRDTDGDGVSDGYEYASAVDMNSQALPYPHKRPYPNPLFKDAEVDYDGDGLTLWDEYSLWTKYGNNAIPLNYSDGKQASVPTPAPDPAGPLYYLDMDRNGYLTDDERDADGDGLGNWDEAHGRMTPEWWEAAYDGENGPLETPYPVKFGGTSMLDPDSDGDGLPDGADDSDGDGLTNAFEVLRPADWALTYVAIGNTWSNWDGTAVTDPILGTPENEARYYSRVQPLNPCKPVWSQNCHLHWPIGHYDKDEPWMGHRSPPPPGPRPDSV